MKGNASTSKYHIMMVFMIIMWGLDYSVAKDALDHVDTFMILNVRYFIGMIVIGIIAGRTVRLKLPDKKDLPLILATALIGHILYFSAEYAAMETIPVANITVILGFLPIASSFVDRFVFHSRLSGRLFAFMILCILGIAMTIGSDLTTLMSGKAGGYMLCVAALFAWLSYLFLTEILTKKYGPVPVALYQTTLAFVLTFPVMAPDISTLPQLPPKILLEMVYLGVVSEGMCFLIEITGLEKLGPTISSVYSNFLPVSTAFFGMILLGQDLSLLQYAGGILVIVSGYLVIRERARLNSLILP